MMELKRLLTRATALLLQGAYQGAESFIEQAMAEADKLKSELAEIDTLRTRVTEMAAEVERLQSVIDDANAQEHIATVGDSFGLFWRGAGPIAHIVEKHGLKIGDKLYARPIPAQQSPAVAVPDSDGVSIIEAALKKVSSGNLAEAPFPLIGENAQCYLNGAASAYQHALEMLCVSSPRITEQDAREIAMSAWRYWTNGYGRTIDTWSEEEWPNVFNKLNDDQNGK